MRTNVMPDYVSGLWQQKINKLNDFLNSPFKAKFKIEISNIAKNEISNWIIKYYQKNLKGNNLEFRKKVVELIQRKELIIRR